MENKYVMALDLSLANTGVTIYDLTTKEFVYIGHINTEKIKKKKDIYHNAIKLKHIYNELADLKLKYPPSVVVIERGFSRFNTATQVIYRVHGVVNYLFYDVNQIYYPVKTIKEAILKGDATKAQIMQAINIKYNDIIFNDEDESDSFSICLTYLIKENLIEWEKPTLPKKKTKAKKREMD